MIKKLVYRGIKSVTNYIKIGDTVRWYTWSKTSSFIVEYIDYDRPNTLLIAGEGRMIVVIKLEHPRWLNPSTYLIKSEDDKEEILRES